MQRMVKMHVPVELTYDARLPASDVQAMLANVIELVRIDGRFSTEQMGETGCVASSVQFPTMERYDLYTGFSDVYTAMQEHLDESFEHLWKTLTDNDNCTFAVFGNRVEYRQAPGLPLVAIYNKPGVTYDFNPKS